MRITEKWLYNSLNSLQCALFYSRYSKEKNALNLGNLDGFCLVWKSKFHSKIYFISVIIGCISLKKKKNWSYSDFFSVFSILVVLATPLILKSFRFFILYLPILYYILLPMYSLTITILFWFDQLLRC